MDEESKEERDVTHSPLYLLEEEARLIREESSHHSRLENYDSMVVGTVLQGGVGGNLLFLPTDVPRGRFELASLANLGRRKKSLRP